MYHCRKSVKHILIYCQKTNIRNTKIQYFIKILLRGYDLLRDPAKHCNSASVSSDIRSHDQQNSEVSQVKYSDIRSHDHQNSEVSQVKYSDIRSNDHQNSEVSQVMYSDIRSNYHQNSEASQVKYSDIRSLIITRILKHLW